MYRIWTICFFLATIQLTGRVLAQSDVSSSQFWHERYHGILSMAAYGDYNSLCPVQTFTQTELEKSFPSSTEEPWTLLQQFGPTESGLEGFVVTVPEMDKIVIVFKGIFGWYQSFNHTPAAAGQILNIGSCNTANCTAHSGALQAYLEARDATDDWALAKAAVESTGHQWSVTGHGFGGMVAQVAALDLGWRGLVKWSHSHGAARVFSPSLANAYNALFGGEAGQRTVANNDIEPTLIPESDDYTFTLQGFHIYGDGISNSTYGMSFEVCNTPDGSACLGGDNQEDHYFYYTPIGMCGGAGAYAYNTTAQEAYEQSASSQFLATATATTFAISVTSTTSNISTAESQTADPSNAVSTGVVSITTTPPPADASQNDSVSAGIKLCANLAIVVLGAAILFV